MKTSEQLEKKYLGRRVRVRHGPVCKVFMIDDDRDAPLCVELPSGVKQFWPTHHVTLLKPKKRELTDEQKQELADKFAAAWDSKINNVVASSVINDDQTHFHQIRIAMGLPRPRGK